MTTPHSETAPRTAWLLLALLTLLNVVNFVDRQLITSLQIPLREDPQLRLTNLQNQLLAGYAFSVVYSLAGLFLGTLADRTHRPRLVAMGLLVWSGMTAASGLAQNFWQLGLARILVAIGEATLTPAAVAMLGDVFRPRQRSLATGLYYLGIPLGASLSLIVANLLWPIPWVGWRGCFVMLGLIGLAMVVVLLFVKDPPRGATEDRAPSESRPVEERSARMLVSEVIETLRKTPALLLTMVGAVLVNIGVGAMWLDSSWLHAERGFSKQGAPIFLGVALLLGGSAGNILGGWLGDRLNQHRPGGRLLALVVLQLAICPFAIAFRLLPGDLRPALFACCVLATVLVTFMYGPVLATVQELTPVRLRATMVALLLIGLNILGASLGAVIAAWLVEILRSYTWGIFITAQVGLLSIPVFLLAYRRYESDHVRRVS
jgi:MFS family permease